MSYNRQYVRNLQRTAGQASPDAELAIIDQNFTDLYSKQVASGAVPIGIPPSGTVTNNGVNTTVTFGTALRKAYTGAYMFFPAGVVYARSFPDFYYVVMNPGSFTVGTVYDNVYFGGNPFRPANPTPIVAAGPGAYTQSVLGVTGPLWPVLANSLGNIGTLEIKALWSNNTTTNIKQLSKLFNNSNISGAGTDQQTTNGGHATRHSVRNTGVPNEQISFNAVNGEAGPGTITDLAVDTTKNVTIGFNMQINVATDWMFLESYEILMHGAGSLESPPPQIYVPASATVRPPGAIAAGLSTNLFHFNPSANDVEGWPSGFANTGSAKLNAGRPYQTKPPTGPYPTSLISNTSRWGRSNVLTLYHDGAVSSTSPFAPKNYTVITQTQLSGQNQTPYLDPANPFYFQAAYATSMNHPDIWCTVFLMPRDHDLNYNSYAEIDIDEAGLVTRGTGNRTSFGALTSVLDWNWPQGSVNGTPPAVSTTHNNSQTNEWGVEIDRTLLNTFGVDWNPTNNIVRYWQNGVQTWQYDTTAFAAHIKSSRWYALIAVQCRVFGTPHYLYVDHLQAWV